MVWAASVPMESSGKVSKKTIEGGEGKFLKARAGEEVATPEPVSECVIHITSDDSGKEDEERKKGILKHMRNDSNKHVDFNMDLEFVPFDEAKDFTIEIQIVEEMPKKVVSYAALYAEQKAQEESEKHPSQSNTEKKMKHVQHSKSTKVNSVKKEVKGKPLVRVDLHRTPGEQREANGPSKERDSPPCSGDSRTLLEIPYGSDTEQASDEEYQDPHLCGEDCPRLDGELPPHTTDKVGTAIVQGGNETFRAETNVVQICSGKGNVCKNSNEQETPKSSLQPDGMLQNTDLISKSNESLCNITDAMTETAVKKIASSSTVQNENFQVDGNSEKDPSPEMTANDTSSGQELGSDQDQCTHQVDNTMAEDIKTSVCIEEPAKYIENENDGETDVKGSKDLNCVPDLIRQGGDAALLIDNSHITPGLQPVHLPKDESSTSALSEASSIDADNSLLLQEESNSSEEYSDNVQTPVSEDSGKDVEIKKLINSTSDIDHEISLEVQSDSNLITLQDCSGLPADTTREESIRVIEDPEVESQLLESRHHLPEINEVRIGNNSEMIDVIPKLKNVCEIDNQRVTERLSELP